METFTVPTEPHARISSRVYMGIAAVVLAVLLAIAYVTLTRNSIMLAN